MGAGPPPSPLFFDNDTASYAASARALLQTGAFSVSPADPQPQTVRTPGYPLFLAAVFALFGENWVAVLAIQSFVSVGTIYLVYCLGARLWDERAGLLAALFLALDLNSMGYALLALTETLFTFFLTAGMLVPALRLRGDQRGEPPRWGSAALAGVCLAAATFVRPITYYLVPLLCLAWFARGLATKSSRELRHALAFSLPLVVLIGGWQARNYALTGSAHFSAIESINWVNYRAAAIIAERDGVSRDEAIAWIREAYGLDMEPGWNEAWKAAGLEIIRAHPSLFVSQWLRGLVNLFINPASETLARMAGAQIGASSPLGDLLRLSPGEYAARWVFAQPGYFALFVLSVLHLLGLYAGTVRGIARPPAAGTLFLLGLAAYLAVVSAGPEADFRFRVPMTPALALLAAAGLTPAFQGLCAPKTATTPQPAS
jgi:4-amino-4-deoxy-L-arabinose transferase-like glycosyltransferase